MKTTPQRLVPNQASQNNDEDGDLELASGRVSIGLAGGRSMRPRSPLVKTNLAVYNY